MTFTGDCPLIEIKVIALVESHSTAVDIAHQHKWFVLIVVYWGWVAIEAI